MGCSRDIAAGPQMIDVGRGLRDSIKYRHRRGRRYRRYYFK